MSAAGTEDLLLGGSRPARSGPAEREAKQCSVFLLGVAGCSLPCSAHGMGAGTQWLQEIQLNNSTSSIPLKMV